MKLEPKDAQSHANLGAAYARLKRYDEGIAELEIALKLKPDDYETLLSLGLRLQAEERLQARDRGLRRRPS